MRRRWEMPFGLSVIALARKPGQQDALQSAEA
jgi:hypothetical protein